MEDWFVDRRTNDDGVLVVCGVGRGRRWKCRVANLFSSVLVFSLGGILGWPIGNGREESIDDNDLFPNGFSVLCSGSNSDRLQALYTVSNYKSKRV
jgi:hypothetical protein